MTIGYLAQNTLDEQSFCHLMVYCHLRIRQSSSDVLSALLSLL